MAMVMIENPNDKAVEVRVVGEGGFLGFGRQDRRMRVGPKSMDSAEMPAGTYYIRYQYGDAGVFQGDSFSLQDGAAVKITLVASTSGNYGIRPSGDKL
jgi:hypothetical protein